MDTNTDMKGTKEKQKRIYRVKVNLNEQELSRYADLAVEAGFRPKAQKLFKESKRTGKQTIDQKAIGKWIRDSVVPEYVAHAWEREQKRAEAMRQIEEGQEKLRKMGRLP